MGGTFRPFPADCPSYNARLTPDAILCVSCGYHLQAGRRLDTRVERTAERLPSQPEGVDIKQTKSMLTFSTRGWTQSGYRMVCVLFLLLLLFCFLSLPVSFVLHNGMIASVAFALSFLILFGFGGYVIAAGFLNRQIIEVTSSHVIIRTEGPIPWPDVGGHVPVADIAQLYVVEKERRRDRSSHGGESNRLSSAITAHDVYHNGSYRYIYDLNLRLTNGWRRRLMTSHDRRLTKYIAKRTSHFLALPETPVLSTWYQRWLFRECTLFDDRDDIDYETAVSAKSLPLVVVIVGCLLVLLLGTLFVWWLAVAVTTVLAN